MWYLLQMTNFLFFFSFSNEHLYALFQILFSNFLQNKIATFFCEGGGGGGVMTTYIFSWHFLYNIGKSKRQLNNKYLIFMQVKGYIVKGR